MSDTYTKIERALSSAEENLEKGNIRSTLKHIELLEHHLKSIKQSIKTIPPKKYADIVYRLKKMHCVLEIVSGAMYEGMSKATHHLKPGSIINGKR